MSSRVFTDPRCLLHQAPPGYPERAARLESVLTHLEAEGHKIVESVAFPRARQHVLALHERKYVERFERAVERGDGLLDSADNPLSGETFRAAMAAVEVALEAANWVAGGPRRKALAAIRPPGHHAEGSLAMGFCFFNNVALAAEYLIRSQQADRVAIFDFDVHHGNGTQHLFEERSDVLYVSTHQYPFYPGTGAADETGRGNGEGSTVNVPLPAGTGDDGYARVLDDVVLPAVRSFAPEVLLLSAGFDAWQRDPLGGMRVTEKGFFDWGRRMAELAEEVSSGRVLAVMEGGYDVGALPSLISGHLKGLREGSKAV